MDVQVIPNAVFLEFNESRSRNSNPPLDVETFSAEIEKWYTEFQESNCSLGYAAQQLGITKVELIAILDMLGWKVTNL